MDGRILGILGGMGPLASAVFLERLTLLTPAARDQDHIPAILWSDPRVPDRAGGPGAAPGEADPWPWLRRGVRGLRAAGCGAIVIPCNTAHLWFDAIAEAAGCPVPHIVDAAAASLRAAGIEGGPVGLLGTATTLGSGLYQKRLAGSGYDLRVPDAPTMAALVTPAVARVKANDIAAAVLPLTEAARGLIARGAQAVILGCTEIPLALRGVDAGAPLIDTLDALALAAIAWARG